MYRCELCNVTFEKKINKCPNCREKRIIEINNYDYEVIEEENEYLILIHSNDGNTSKIYYSNYITKENMDNTDEYLNNLKNSFTEIVLPSLNGFGYLTTEESNYKYPVFADSTNDYFIIKEDGLVYLMK